MLNVFINLHKKIQLEFFPTVFITRQRPTFPGGLPPSIISAEELNFRVRDGNGCVLFAIVTGLMP